LSESSFKPEMSRGLSAGRHIAWVSGFLIGIPVSYPGPPYYWLALGCFTFAVLKSWSKLVAPEEAGRGTVVLALVLVALVSNVVNGLHGQEIELQRVLGTSLFFVLFLYGALLRSPMDFLRGFSVAMAVFAALVLGAALVLRIDEYGLLLFSVPDFRLWGNPYFPDWPNYLAFLLSVGFLLNTLLFRHPVFALIMLGAALLTTSRTPLLAVALSIIPALFNSKVLVKVASLSVVLLSALFLIDLASSYMGDSELWSRLLIFEDRQEIFEYGLPLILDAPLLGHGSVLFDESIGFQGQASFHNTYLDVALRHGLVSLCLFLVLASPRLRDIRKGGAPYASLVLFFLLGSFFQNFLKHPHIVLLYVVLLRAAPSFHGLRKDGRVRHPR